MSLIQPKEPAAQQRIVRDLSRLISQPQVVFDVGANVGQSTATYHDVWPQAQVYAFEPVKETFRALQAKFASSSAVTLENMALGAAPNPAATIRADGVSTMNSLVEDGRVRGSVETIEVMTGDAYCDDRGIPRIDFLKIDTEGHDLKVLVGLARMLRDGRISFLQVESGMNPENSRHANIAAFLGFLEPLGYYLYGVYDQVREKSDPTVLRRANLVFSRKGAGSV